METAVVIEKIIEGYDCEYIIKMFREVSLFTHEIFVTPYDLTYRYTCSNCNVTYYGKTYQHFFSEQQNIWEFLT